MRHLLLVLLLVILVLVLLLVVVVLLLLCVPACRQIWVLLLLSVCMGGKGRVVPVFLLKLFIHLWCVYVLHVCDYVL